MFEKIMKGIKGCDDSEEGGFNTGHVWKSKKKLSPRVNDVPSARKNSEGKLLTTQSEILNEAEKHYKDVFNERQIDPKYENYKNERDTLASKRIEECKNIKTPQ